MTSNHQLKLCCIAIAVSAALNGSAIASEAANNNTNFALPSVSQTDFGGVGLLQMPTARMANTGEFSANYRDDKEYRRYAISLQATDWFEATARYTDIRTRPYSLVASFSGDQTYKDKGFDIKGKLWREDYWLPEISLGLRDIGGTSLFDSEYIVGTKKTGPFDITLGIGWGNMAESGNIKKGMCYPSYNMCQRTESNQPGQFEIGNLFHGPVATFGGVEYQTPWRNLRLKLEYEGNNYSNEYAGIIQQRSPLNVGLVYRANDFLDTTLSYQRGNTLMWGFTLRTNFNELTPSYINSEPPTYSPKTISEIDSVDWRKVKQELNQQAGYSKTTIYADKQKVIVSGEQTKYRDKSEVNLRAATVLANNLPATVTEYEIVNKKRELPVSATTINANKFKQQQAGLPLGEHETPYAAAIATPSEFDHAKQVAQEPRDRWSFSVEPALSQSIGGAESFYMYQIGAKGNADLAITDGLSLGSTANLNLINNYDQFNYKSPPLDGAALPRVRTWVREYVTSSDLLLTNLQLTQLNNPAPNWYSQVYAGYLEMMYAGVGSETLYRPHNRDWAIGVDVNYAKQRDWNDIMQLADYDVVTGHMTTYWQLPFVNKTLAKISAGQYLAGDKGVTFDLSRQFNSGIIAGVFMTKTNVSASEYGEGSFTKGFYITIPLDLMLVRPTIQAPTVSWVPLTRDGGQMLGKRYGLYNLTK